MNHIVFLVEDLSTEKFLEGLLSQFEDRFSFEILSFQGKQDFKSSIKGYLRGYVAWAPKNYRYVTICDRDSDNCINLKIEIEKIMSEVGLITPSINRIGYNSSAWIAIEELEAWIIGDSTALAISYPKLPDISHRAKFRDPDAITGGTWEALERELQNAGYYSAGLSKLEIASKMGIKTKLENNRSRSFQGFISRIMEMSL